MTVRLMLLGGAVVLCLLLGLSVGSVSIPLRDVWNGLWSGRGEGAAIVRDLRAPRVVLDSAL